MKKDEPVCVRRQHSKAIMLVEMFGQHVGRFAPHLSHCNNPFEVKKMLKEEKTLLRTILQDLERIPYFSV